jgi:hypothetical protein
MPTRILAIIDYVNWEIKRTLGKEEKATSSLGAGVEEKACSPLLHASSPA